MSDAGGASGTTRTDVSVDLSVLAPDVVEAACLYSRSVRQTPVAVAQMLMAVIVAYALLMRYGEAPSHVGGFPFGFVWFTAAVVFVIGAGIYYGAAYLKRSVAFRWLLSARALTAAPALPDDARLRDWAHAVAAARKSATSREDVPS